MQLLPNIVISICRNKVSINNSPFIDFVYICLVAHTLFINNIKKIDQKTRKNGKKED